MRCAIVIAVLFFAGPALAGEVAGGVYKCTDDNGAVTYSTSPCKGVKREFLSKEKLEGKISTIEFPKPEANPEPSKPEPLTLEAAAVSEKVPAGSAAAVTPAVVTEAAPATPVANPKIRTLPIERKLRKD